MKRKQKVDTMSLLKRTSLRDQQEEITNSFALPKPQIEENHKFQSNQIYKNHEKKLIWLSFGVAVVMLISIIGRIVS
jgi:hypothetical protein